MTESSVRWRTPVGLPVVQVRSSNASSGSPQPVRGLLTLVCA
jgi:hypothetical protein